MTSAEEVPHIPCSIGARQAEPPASEEELVHFFFASTCNFDWPYYAPQARRGAHMWRDQSMASTEEVPHIPSISSCVNKCWIFISIHDLFMGDIQDLFTHALMEEEMSWTSSVLAIDRSLHM